jgi:hypothetical protein
VPDCVAQRRQLAAIVQHNRLGKPQIPGHDATTRWRGNSFRHKNAPDDAGAFDVL